MLAPRDGLEPPTKWLIRLRRTLPAELADQVVFDPLSALPTFEIFFPFHGLASVAELFGIDKFPGAFLSSCIP